MKSDSRAMFQLCNVVCCFMREKAFTKEEMRLSRPTQQTAVTSRILLQLLFVFFNSLLNQTRHTSNLLHCQYHFHHLHVDNTELLFGSSCQKTLKRLSDTQTCGLVSATPPTWHKFGLNAVSLTLRLQQHEVKYAERD